MKSFTLEPQDIATLALLGSELDEVMATISFDIPQDTLEELEILQSHLEEFLERIQKPMPQTISGHAN